MCCSPICTPTMPEGSYPVTARHFFHTRPSTWPRPTPTTGSTRCAAAAIGVQRLVHDSVSHALAPYRDTDRFATFRHVDEVIPGVRAVDLAGHSPGHTGYLLGEDDATVLFRAILVHSHTVQLRRPVGIILRRQ